MVEHIQLWRSRLKKTSLWKQGFKPLEEGQVLQLASQGNRIIDSHKIFIEPGAQLNEIHGSWLEGPLWISSQVRIFQSRLKNTVLCSKVQIFFCPLLEGAIIEEGASVEEARILCTQPTRFGHGTFVKAGLESAGRELAIWNDMSFEDGINRVQKAKSFAPLDFANFQLAYSILGPQAKIQGGYWDRVYAGGGTVGKGVLLVENSTLFGNQDEPVVLGPGIILRSSLLQWGSKLDSGALVEDSMLMEYSGVERQGKVSSSLLGPNTTVALGEVSASLLGPWVGFHHQSLLIAAWWPEGKGNVASGAQVGSNHSSRAPDQRISIGEGLFFGLSSCIKFPGDYSNAPFSIIASGLICAPQRLELPFSLLVPLDKGSSSSVSVNRVIPAWVLEDNAYTLFRNQYKWKSRNKAKRHVFSTDVLKQENVEKMWKAYEQLGKIQGKEVYNCEDFPGIGANILFEKDRVRAREAYEKWMIWGVLACYIQGILAGENHVQLWPQFYFPKLGMDWNNQTGNIRRYLEMQKEVLKKVKGSKTKDVDREQIVFGEGASEHHEDEFLAFLALDWAEEEKKLAQFI